MKGIETGKDKVKKICDVLRRETLEPAQVEAEELIQQAHKVADEMILEARRSIEKMEIEARQNMERERKIFESSIAQACKQALELLRQNIEEKLFNRQLLQVLSKHTQDPNVIALLIGAVVKALEKDGIDAQLSVYVPTVVSARSINVLLGQEIMARLAEKSVLIGSIDGGIQIKLHKENITLDISAGALKEIVSIYVRKDFRELLFGKKGD